MFFTQLACYFIFKMKGLWQVVCLIASIALAYAIPVHEMPLKIDVAFMAIPFYMSGFYCKQFKILDNINHKIVVALACFVATLILVYFQGNENMCLRMFGNYPGLYYPLCLMSLVVYVLSFSYFKERSNTIEYLSKGTIVIMAFQGLTNLLVVSAVQCFDIHLPIPTTICSVVFFAPLSFLLTVPLIIFVKRYLPEAMGNRK